MTGETPYDLVLEIAELKDTPAGQAACETDPALMLNTIIDRAKAVLRGGGPAPPTGRDFHRGRGFENR